VQGRPLKILCNGCRVLVLLGVSVCVSGGGRTKSGGIKRSYSCLVCGKKDGLGEGSRGVRYVNGV